MTKEFVNLSELHNNVPVEFRSATWTLVASQLEKASKVDEVSGEGDLAAYTRRLATQILQTGSALLVGSNGQVAVHTLPVIEIEARPALEAPAAAPIPQRKIKQNRAGKRKGSPRLASKRTEDEIRELRKLHDQGWTESMLAKRFNMSSANAHLIVTRQTHKNVK